MEENDDFDFDEFLENSNNDFNHKLESYKEAMISAAIDVNYHQIMKQGISDWHVRLMDPSEIGELMQTFNTMIAHYEELEEYEKCAHLVKQRETIKHNLALKQDV
jgi:hypothetical protein|tara:strand:+ start:1282 stop:1596 length:315 start_codon:yes stop_codon:yes gene_type:complete